MTELILTTILGMILGLFFGASVIYKAQEKSMIDTYHCIGEMGNIKWCFENIGKVKLD